VLFVLVVGTIGFLYGTTDVARKSIQFDLRKIGESIYEAHSKTGKWPAKIADFEGTEYLEPHVFADYEEMCLYQQTSPGSHFTKARICSRLTPDGRLTITGNRFITTKGNTRAERELTSDSEVADALREHFGIVM
jgi:arylamine N-acetyltransferase